MVALYPNPPFFLPSYFSVWKRILLPIIWRPPILFLHTRTIFHTLSSSLTIKSVYFEATIKLMNSSKPSEGDVVSFRDRLAETKVFLRSFPGVSRPHSSSSLLIFLRRSFFPFGETHLGYGVPMLRIMFNLHPFSSYTQRTVLTSRCKLGGFNVC